MEALRWILLLAGAVLVAVIYWRGRQQERAAGGDSLFERARRGLSRDGADPEPHHGDSRTEPDLDISDDELRGFDFDTGARTGPGPDTIADTAVEARDAASASPSPGPADEGPAAAGSAVEEGAAARTAGGTETPDDSEGGAEEPQEAGPVSPSAQRVVVLYVVASPGERLVGSRLLEALERRGLRHGAYAIFHAGDSEGSTVFSVANAVDPGTFDRSTMDTLSTPGVAFFLQVPGPQTAETAFDRMLQTARGVADDLEARVLDEQHSTLTRQTEQHLREELRLIDRRTGLQ